MIYLLAETSSMAQPWWIGAITGSIGTIVSLAIATKTLWFELKHSRQEVSDVTKESIEVITKILSKQQENEKYNLELRESIRLLTEHIHDEKSWQSEAMRKIDNILENK